LISPAPHAELISMVVLGGRKVAKTARWKRLGKWGIALIILNEIRGLCVAVPIFWAWLHH
jgi:hypothetical protein